ncbi:MAG: cation transporter [Chloroflexi bacterium]|nr:cation transporter [Chloroflexota bacterium]
MILTCDPPWHDLNKDPVARNRGRALVTGFVRSRRRGFVQSHDHPHHDSDDHPHDHAHGHAHHPTDPATSSSLSAPDPAQEGRGGEIPPPSPRGGRPSPPASLPRGEGGGGEGRPHLPAAGSLRFLFHHHAPAFDDPAVPRSDRGIWALRVSLVGLLTTALIQAVIVALSGSVALLADTIHNFADALTALPLWVAFTVARRPANRSYTYGYGRAEDLAGVAIVAVIFFSACLAAYESYQRLIDPRPLRYVGWVAGAAIVGFLGNELVARLRISVGREIGSAALIADGQHARVDSLTSLSVLIGAAGSLAGYPILDPLVGFLITVAILQIVRESAAAMSHRLMDAVDPSLVDLVERTARTTPGVHGAHDVRVRWLGHSLEAGLHLEVDASLTTAESHAIAEKVRHRLFHDVPRLATVFVHIDPWSSDGSDHHAVTAHHATPSTPESHTPDDQESPP